jgi:hypothetical protein
VFGDWSKGEASSYKALSCIVSWERLDHTNSPVVVRDRINSTTSAGGGGDKLLTHVVH